MFLLLIWICTFLFSFYVIVLDIHIISDIEKCLSLRNLFYMSLSWQVVVKDAIGWSKG